MRQEFRERHLPIRQTVECLATEFAPLYSLAVEDAIVDWLGQRTADLLDFPYHYNRKTYETFAEMVRATGAWPS